MVLPIFSSDTELKSIMLRSDQQEVSKYTTAGRSFRY